MDEVSVGQNHYAVQNNDFYDFSDITRHSAGPIFIREIIQVEC
jgi:hypothetical protein